MKISINIKRFYFLIRYEWTLSQFANVTCRAIISSLRLPISIKKNSDYYFKKKWLKEKGKLKFFDFNGAKLPYIENQVTALRKIFEDTFFVSCYFNDNYDRKTVEHIDKYAWEGPYGYVDKDFDVTIKPGMVVIDAGAWMGDFSAYTATKGAVCYAFEPVLENFQWLCETKSLNKQNEGTIIPVQKGLSNFCGKVNIFLSEQKSGMHSMIVENANKEEISVTTLDRFVKEEGISRIDFIKADIEGEERNMLKGAFNTLKTLSPKLAICTYHLPDDREVLTKIIMEANPDYKIKYLRHKLFATV